MNFNKAKREWHREKKIDRDNETDYTSVKPVETADLTTWWFIEWVNWHKDRFHRDKYLFVVTCHKDVMYASRRIQG